MTVSFRPPGGMDASSVVAFTALSRLAAVLDYDKPNVHFCCGNECEGCQAELVEASRIVGEAYAKLGWKR